jgi:hypothetical protein
MKQLFVLAFCLGLAFTAKTIYASSTVATSVVSVTFNEDEKTAVKPEELPEPIKKTLAAEEYKGWAVQSAAIVKTATAFHYEVSLANDKKETKMVKFDKEGALLK